MKKPLRRRAAFLDRDGVINVDVGYLHRPADLRLTYHAAEALHELTVAGYLLIVITNQSGIGRGYYEEDDFTAVSEVLAARLAIAGATLTATYHCPHAPNALCLCRKPLPGLLNRALAEWDIDPGTSIMIGDKASDIAAGRAAGIDRCYRIGAANTIDRAADAIFPNLWECAQSVITAQHGGDGA